MTLQLQAIMSGPLFRSASLASRRVLTACLFMVSLLLNSLGAAGPQAAQGLAVAAASDVQFALPAIASEFEKDTGHKVTLTFGSSGNFFTQIQNGAPFDVLLSADIDYPRQLERSGLAELVSRNCDQARKIAAELKQAGVEVLNDVVLNQVVVTFGDDDRTRRVIASIQDSGRCWCGGSTWRGRAAMRISVSSWATTDEDVELSVRAILDAERAA